MTTTNILTKTQINALARFTKKKDEKLSLFHVSFGKIWATDSHRMAIVNNSFDLENDYTYNKDLEKQDVKVMNFAQFGNKFDNKITENNTFTINVNEWYNVHNTMKNLIMIKSHKNKLVQMRTHLDNTISFRAESNVGMVWERTLENVKFEYHNYDKKLICYNNAYMLDILKLFKAFKIKEVKVSYYGSVTPILFESLDGSVKALLLPVRTYFNY